MSTAAQLDLIIRAQDQASRVLRGVSKDVDGLDASFAKLGLGGVVSVAALTAAVTKFATDGLREFMQAEQVMAQTEAALKSTGMAAGVTADHIGELSNSFMRLSGVDDEAAQSAANVLLTFTNIRNVGVDKIFDAAALAALNLSTRMGTDLQSATVLVGKALNDPIRGMTALSKAGVQLTSDQKQLIKTFVESGDVMAAQKVILGELETQFGGSAEAAGKTLSGQMKILQERFSNFQGQIMGEVVPALLALTGFIDDTSVAVGKLAEKMGEIKEPFEGAFGFLSDALDLVPDEVKGAAVAFASLTVPIAGVAENAYLFTRVIDHFSDSADDASNSTDQLGNSLAYAQGQARNAARDLGVARSAIEGPMAALAIRESLQGMAEDAIAAKEAADKARRAFFDLLHQPSPERQTREYLLKQAQFNVARLEQQGATDGLLSPDRQSWYQWLVNTFIPTQEDWLRTDELNVDRNEAAAILAETLTGNYKDLYRVMDGQLLPGMNRFNDATYDATGRMQDLESLSPVNVTVTDTGMVATKNKVQDVLDKYDELRKTGDRDPAHLGLTTNQMTAGKNEIQDVLDKYDELRKTGDRNPARMPVVTNQMTSAKNAVQDTLDKYDELRKTGDRNPARMPVVTNQMTAARNATQETLDKYDELRKTGDRNPARMPVVTNQMTAARNVTQEVLDKYDETRKLGGASTPINYQSAVDTANWLKAVRDRWYEIKGLFNPFKGVTVPTITPNVPIPPGMPPPPGSRGVGYPGGGGLSMAPVGALHVHFHGQADLSTPVGRSYIVNNLWAEINARMRTG